MTKRRAAVALAAICFCLGASGAALAKSKRHRHHKRSPHGHQAGSASEGKSHLKRANALAGEGDCAAAIEEYTKAYEMLGDPVVLFNRGECYRRNGDSENAVDDYREFLEKVPNAPNRADIEAKVVALEAPEPASPREPAAVAPPPPAPKPAEAAAPPPPAPSPRVDSRPVPAAAVVSAAPVDDSGPGAGTRPWVWITLAVLVAGAAVGSYLMFRPGDEPPPSTALGNYRF